MMDRCAAKVDDGVVTDVLVVADGAQGDATIAALGLVEQPGVLPGIGWAWDGEAFIEPEPQPDPVTMQSQQERRADAYRDESDPLFFKWQRGEGTEQEWMDAVQSIRDRYPYP
jgi:hypothetical protein